MSYLDIIIENSILRNGHGNILLESSSIHSEKFFKPRLPTYLIHRLDLFEQLDNSLSNRLIYIHAPAGYGKTTLVNSWIRRISTNSIWMTLNESDNEPVEFFTGILAAFHVQNEDLEHFYQLLATTLSPTRPEEQIARSFLQIVNRLPFTIIILDNFHEITQPVIQKAIALIIQNQTENLSDLQNYGCRFILISRRKLPFSITEWRLRDEITEISVSQLRFSLNQAHLLLKQTVSLNLTDQDVQKLYACTEGWPAGLTLAAQEIKTHPDESASELINKFSSHSQILAEFFFDELLSTQENEIKQFLIKTACLDLLKVDLCNQIMGNKASREILSLLQNNNVFIERTIQKDECYRYHPLFAGVLRKNFALLPQEEQNSVHATAAKWSEENGYLVECVKHLVASRNFHYLDELLSTLTPIYLSHAETIKLRSMYDLIPLGVFQNYPWMSIYRAWVYSSTEPDSTKLLIQQARNAIELARSSGKYQHDEIDLMVADITSLQAITTMEKYQSAEITTVAEQALVLQGDRLPKVKGLVLKFLADTYIQHNQFDQALKLLLESKQLLLEGGNFGGVAEASYQIGEIYFAQGMLRKAENEFKETISSARFTSEDPSFPYCCYSGLGSVQLEWNDLENSHTNLQMGYALSRSRFRSGEIISGLLLARYYQRVDDLEKAGRILSDLQKPLHSQCVTASLEARYDSCYLLQLAQSGDYSRMEYVIKKCHLDIDSAHQAEQESLLVSYAVAMLYSNKHDICLKILRGIEQNIEDKNHIGALLVSLVIKASCYHTLGMEQEAEKTALRALEIGRENNFIRIFVDFRKYLLSTLTGFMLGKKGELIQPNDTYLGEIINASLLADQNQNPRMDKRNNPKQWMPLVSGGFLEQLTFQEQKILVFLSCGKSNAEIARDMGISINTVKKHTANIYDKLGVHDRLHASNRARELGLI